MSSIPPPEQYAHLSRPAGRSLFRASEAKLFARLLPRFVSTYRNDLLTFNFPQFLISDKVSGGRFVSHPTPIIEKNLDAVTMNGIPASCESCQSCAATNPGKADFEDMFGASMGRRRR